MYNYIYSYINSSKPNDDYFEIGTGHQHKLDVNVKIKCFCSYLLTNCTINRLCEYRKKYVNCTYLSPEFKYMKILIRKTFCKTYKKILYY